MKTFTLCLVTLACLTLTGCLGKTNVITQKKEMVCFKQVSGDLLTDTNLQNRTDLDYPNDTDMLITVQVTCPKIYFPLIFKEADK
jgi:hypothetical protein